MGEERFDSPALWSLHSLNPHDGRSGSIDRDPTGSKPADRPRRRRFRRKRVDSCSTRRRPRRRAMALRKVCPARQRRACRGI